MAIRDIVTRGFGSWQTSPNFLPTRGYSIGTPPVVSVGHMAANWILSPSITGEWVINPSLSGKWKLN